MGWVTLGVGANTQAVPGTRTPEARYNLNCRARDYARDFKLKAADSRPLPVP
jgi:hypothetical protein